MLKKELNHLVSKTIKTNTTQYYTEGYIIKHTQSLIVSRRNVLTMSVTCVDERMAPRVHQMSFRVPGAYLFPRGTEPSYTLAAVLFLCKIGDFYQESRVVVADHGTLGKKGYFGCGMFNLAEDIEYLKNMLDINTDLNFDQKNDLLYRAQLLDIANLGGIGKHAAWEVKKLQEIEEQFKVKALLGRILPNSKEREEIPNKRLVITQPYVDQRGLFANKDEFGEEFDGSTIIHTIAGKSTVTQDYTLTSELMIFGYMKGESISEVMILEPTMNFLNQSPLRRLLQRIQQTLDYSIKMFSEEIAPIANLSEEECYRYLLSIKETVNASLYGTESDQLRKAKRFAEEVKALGILPKNVVYTYGLVSVNGGILKLSKL